MGNNSSMPKVKKPFYRRGWFIFIAIIVVIAIILSVRGAIQKASQQKATYTWPDSALAAMIPQPDSRYGKIHMENEDYFSIEIYKFSKQQFEDYIEECKNSGFTVDYQKTDDYYWADHEAGYSLTLNYDEKEKILNISLTAPAEENPSDEIPSGEDDTDPLPEANNEESGSTDDFEDEPEIENPSESEADESGGIRPEFKEALDGYEAFIDEYCEFMKNYAEADTSDLLSMASDYSKMMEKELEWAEKIQKLDDGSLSTTPDAHLLFVIPVRMYDLPPSLSLSPTSPENPRFASV